MLYDKVIELEGRILGMMNENIKINETNKKLKEKN